VLTSAAEVGKRERSFLVRHGQVVARKSVVAVERVGTNNAFEPLEQAQSLQVICEAIEMEQQSTGFCFTRSS